MTKLWLPPTVGLPLIRFHDLRHTHAALLVAAGVPIEVASERLGHAHPGFTMHIYQHLLLGIGAAAATQFAEQLVQHRHRRLTRHFGALVP